jgi:hypothetical protein
VVFDHTCVGFKQAAGVRFTKILKSTNKACDQQQQQQQQV